MCLKALLLCYGLMLGALTFETEEELRHFIDNDFEPNISIVFLDQVNAEWNFVTDFKNQDKEQHLIDSTLKAADTVKYFWQQYFKNLTEGDYVSEDIKRKVILLKVLGHAALDNDQLSELTALTSNMTNIYSSVKICPYVNKSCDLATEGLTLTQGIEAIISKSTNYDELTYVWKAWRDASGAKIKQQYNTYVELSNAAAVANGFADKSEFWKYQYETPTFEEDLEALWQQLKPLYSELHKYVSSKLKERYGDAIDLSDGLIPAQVLGNMWGQSWINLINLVKPYPDASSANVTAALREQNYTVLRMFETSNEFYTSMGLEDCAISYDTSAGSVIEKPSDRDIICHASAWDFYDKQNFRIKMCSEVDYDDFVVIHHEMGHIQYFLLYKNQPITFRSGANPGFHEAVGDTIALSVTTPKHLKQIGLVTKYEETVEADINALMEMALERVAFLPFGYLIDKWRWDVFSGKVTPEQYNSHWWKYRQEIQMVKPPIKRSDDTDFDPGAKYHVAGDAQYISYFVAHILEFQFYRGLCLIAGEYDPVDPEKPLNRCNFYGNLDAGQKLRDGLSLGASKHWRDVLKTITGEEELDASAILAYFQPLYDFLVEQNKKV